MRRFTEGRSSVHRSRVPRPVGGWSLLELTVAASLLLLGLLALVPLFIRAMRDVARAAAESEAALLSQDALERQLRPGEPSSSPFEYFGVRSQVWSSAPPSPPDQALWVRETSVGFVELRALADGAIDEADVADSVLGKQSAPLLVLMRSRVTGVSSGEIEAVAVRLERLGQ